MSNVTGQLKQIAANAGNNALSPYYIISVHQNNSAFLDVNADDRFLTQFSDVDDP
jgi:hypothetical protein